MMMNDARNFLCNNTLDPIEFPIMLRNKSIIIDTDATYITGLFTADDVINELTVFNGTVFERSWEHSSIFFLEDQLISKYEDTVRLPWQLPAFCDICLLIFTNTSFLVQTG